MASNPNRSPARKRTAAAAVRRRPEEVLVENLFYGGLLFFLAIIVYVRVFHAGFIWDDDQLLTANQQVQSPDGWWKLWVQPAGADYFPLTMTSLWAEWPFWGVQNPGGYHFTNVLFHAVVTVLSWQTLKRLRVPGAWLAAAIFAVHPICVESVAWIAERKNTISQIFFLLSIINYLWYQEKGKLWRYLMAVVCFLLALLAKTSVVMLPFILWLFSWWRYKDLEPMRENYELKNNPIENGILLWSCVAAGIMAGWAVMFLNPVVGGVAAVVDGVAGFVVGKQLRRLKIWSRFAGFEVIRTIPLFLVAIFLGAVTVYFQYGRAVGQEVIPIGNLLQRSISACFAAGFYLYSALWPFNIIEIYPQWHRAFSTVETFPTWHISPPAPEALPYWKQIIPGIFIAAVFGYCWYRRAETWARAMLVGLGSYFLAMLPALGFLTMSYMRLTLVADHFQYISILSVIALVVAAGQQRRFNPIWLIVAALFFAIFAWVNWADNVDTRLAEFLWVAGALALAAVAAREDLWKPVWYGFVMAILGTLILITWNQAAIYQGEESLWTATLAKNPYTWQGHNHLGAALYTRSMATGDVSLMQEAYKHFAKAVELKPENPESHNNLGLAISYFAHRENSPEMLQEAIKQFVIAVTIKDDPSMEANLGNAYEQAGEFDKAVDTYNKSLNLNPYSPAAQCNLGFALMKLNRVAEAIPHFINAVRLDPNSPLGRGDLMQAIQASGVDPNAPGPPGTYSPDIQQALDLLHSLPPLPPNQPSQ
jgi:tetratricopeptide (TPR) repeat protein